MQISLLALLICCTYPYNCTPFSATPIKRLSKLVLNDAPTGKPTETERNLARMLSAVKVKRKEASTAPKYPSENLTERGQGFGAPSFKTLANVSEFSPSLSAGRSRAVEKERYRELLRAAKKSDSLVKVVGGGVDAKMPKQTFTSGSSRGK
jgi:hypothetical protein